MDNAKNNAKRSQEVKPRKAGVGKNKSIQFAAVAIIILAIVVAWYFYFSNNQNSKMQTSKNITGTPIITSMNNSNTTFNNTLPLNNTFNQNASGSNNSNYSNVTQLINQTLNQTVNYTQLCLNRSVYVGNFNLATRNLNYSWAPYYGVFYVRVYVDYSSTLGKPFADVSDVLAFNGTDCSYTPVFEGQTIVLPACNFIMKVNSISLIGGVWVANADISHC